MLSLHALKLFVVVAEELHFGRAALRLHIAQPPLSQQIRQLEAALGTRLLTRTTRSVELTLAGRVLLERATQLLADADAAENAVRQVAEGRVGSVALGFTSSAAYRVLPGILETYRAGYPDVEMVLRELTTDVQIADLRSGKLDVAIVRADQTVADATLDSFEVEREPMVLAMAREHPLAQSRTVQWRDLDGVSLVSFSRRLSPYFRNLCERVFLAAGIQPRVEQESVLPTMLALVEAGIGVALVPASAAEMRSSRLVYRQLAPLEEVGVQPVEAILHCAWARNLDNPAAHALINLLRIG
nr:LysR substrate-binding domain-containing protein [uncultured Cupriavidus sp.]